VLVLVRLLQFKREATTRDIAGSSDTGGLATFLRTLEEKGLVQSRWQVVPRTFVRSDTRKKVKQQQPVLMWSLTDEGRRQAKALNMAFKRLGKVGAGISLIQGSPLERRL
jgi:hypothetical protein